MSAGQRVRFWFRGALSLLMFAFFGIGALLITPLMLLFRQPTRCQPIVRFMWRLLIWSDCALGLIRVVRGNLGLPKGTILVANHPSLIDVVILSVLVPKTLYIAKHSLLGNPFLSFIVRATSLPDDERLLAEASRYLAKGWNVLIFPEGTRSERIGELRQLRRGAAHLALSSDAPVMCVGISVSRRILGKDQPPWDVGTDPVIYAFSADETSRERVRDGESRHVAAVRITRMFRNRLIALIH